jgi:hypothetical protein
MHWSIAALVPADSLQRCGSARIASKVDVSGRPTHALLPARRPFDTSEVMIPGARAVPVGWRLIAPMRTESQLGCANNSSEEWVVHERNGALAVGRNVWHHTLHLAQPGGELMGLDFGEFGGRIEWLGREGDRTVVEANVNPVAAIEHGDSIFVATGLDHLADDHGDIRRLHRDEDGHWRSRRWLDLGGAPLATHSVDAHTWRIVTTQGVVDVDLDDGTLRRVYSNPDWAQIYPTSIQRLGDTWFIAARHAVIRLTPGRNGLQERWLVASECSVRD